MEHITISELTAGSAPVIPYVGSKAWDNTPFLTYMEREGWSEDQLVGQDEKCKRTIDAILDFLQTWLYFGLLAESCGTKGQRAYFVQVDDTGQYVIYTKYLRAIWREEKKRRSGESEYVSQQWQAHLTACLNKTHSVLAKLGVEKVSYLASPVIFGIVSLCDFVKKTILTDTSRLLCSMLPHSGICCLSVYMTEQKWCPTNVQRLGLALDVASLLLVASQPRPDPEKDHSKCISKVCVAYQVDIKDYVRRHDTACTRLKCIDCPVRPAELHSILISESIPLTRCTENESGDISIQVVKSNTQAKYVAISHVWSDGYGNPEANALYSCQASRISQYVAALMGVTKSEAVFWIDTLSCPVEPDEDTELAISKMRETYANADKVLVLNDHLLRRPKPALCLEVLALIISSSWTRRLWTLQEGVLAKEVWFQFEDEGVELNTTIALALLELNQFLEADSLEYAAILNMATTLHDFWSKFDQKVTEITLSRLHSELQWRSTSVPSDEPLCVSALLGIPLRDIVSVDVEQRKVQLWKQIKHPPRRIAFWSGQHLTHPGFRWAPESLLSMSSSYFFQAKMSATIPSNSNTHDSKPDTEVTDTGLLLRGDSLRLGLWHCDISDGFFLNLVHGALLWVTRMRHSTVETPVNTITPPSTNILPATKRRQLSLVLETLHEQLISPSQEGAVSALLVSHDYIGDQSVDNIPAQIEDVCNIFPAYFLTGYQRKIVDENWVLCMKSLENVEDDDTNTDGEVAQVASMKDQESDLMLTPSISNHQVRRSDGNHFYVTKDADGTRAIELDDKLWRTECLHISLNQSWCLG